MPTSSLRTFTQRWVIDYRRKQSKIALFDTRSNRQFTQRQKRRFFIRFDPLRRNFTGLLGHLAGMAPDHRYKDVLARNWAEENGVGGNNPYYRSHDFYYGVAAQAVGVDMMQEIFKGNTASRYGKKFNESFAGWIVEQVAIYGKKRGWSRIWSAFCAYEMLDNVDYPSLLALARKFGLSGDALWLFEIHVAVQHYDRGRALLVAIWKKNPRDVQDGFAFIKRQQLTAFSALSDDVLKH